MRKFTPTLLAIALLASSCSSNIDLSGSPVDEAPTPDSSALPSDDPVVTLDDIDLVARLFPFAQCTAFLDYVQGEAAERVGPYGLNNYGGYGGFPIEERVFDQQADISSDEVQDAPAEEPASAPAVEASPDEGESATGGSDDTANGPTFSGTNVQEQGVDEPDIVKTDGNIIVTLSNNMLTVVDVSAGDPAVVGSLRIDDGWIQEFFLAGDKLIAVGEGNGSFASNNSVSISATPAPLVVAPIQELDSDAGVPEPDFATEPAIVEDENYPVDGYWVQTAKVWTVDLSSAPRVEETLHIEGRYLSARAVNGNIRIVTTSSPNELPFLYPQNQSGEDRAEQANREIVAESVLADWLPNFERRSANGDVLASGPLTSCDQIHRPEAFAGFEMLTVTGIGTDGDLTPTSTAVLAAGETVYASTESLYVATTRWPEWGISETDDFEDAYTTSIHKFATSDDGTATYGGSGSVRGHLLSQFSMSEYDGNLRIATTAGSPWGNASNSESFITILADGGETLNGIGQVGNMGNGEEIFAVRFVDETAYVVTFRQVDPFYVVDLSDPTSPVVRGELKIPGYSSYLHPIGDGLVLGVGQDADTNGRTQGAKVSLFDVSDPTNPVELDTWVEIDGYSDVEWDHRAFTWWAPENMAILPVSSWQTGFFGAVVLEVTRDGGINEVGRVDQVDTNSVVGSHDCTELEPANRATTYEEAQTELDYILIEGGKLVACEPGGNANPVVGFGCDGRVQLDETKDFWGTDPLEYEATLGAPLEADVELFLCWPNYNGDPIDRTLIVNDDLWTVSSRYLQAHDLADLTQGPRFEID